MYESTRRSSEQFDRVVQARSADGIAAVVRKAVADTIARDDLALAGAGRDVAAPVRGWRYTRALARLRWFARASGLLVAVAVGVAGWPSWGWATVGVGLVAAEVWVSIWRRVGAVVGRRGVVEVSDQRVRALLILARTSDHVVAGGGLDPRVLAAFEAGGRWLVQEARAFDARVAGGADEGLLLGELRECVVWMLTLHLSVVRGGSLPQSYRVVDFDAVGRVRDCARAALN